MNVDVKPAEPTMVLSLRKCSVHGVALVATVEGEEQDLMIFDTSPTSKDEDSGPVLIGHTLKLKDNFPVAVDAHGHIQVRMKA